MAFTFSPKCHEINARSCLFKRNTEDQPCVHESSEKIGLPCLLSFLSIYLNEFVLMLSSGNFQRNFGQFKRENEVLILQSLASSSIIFFIPLHVLAGLYRISAFSLSRSYPPTDHRRVLRNSYVVFIASNVFIECYKSLCWQYFQLVRSPTYPYTTKQLLARDTADQKNFKMRIKRRHGGKFKCHKLFLVFLVFPLERRYVDGYIVFCGKPQFSFRLICNEC